MDQRTTIHSLNQRLSRLTEDRPFRFNDVTLKWIQHKPPYGLWTIERIVLEFENVGETLLNWTMKELHVEYLQQRIIIPVPGGRYSIIARQSMIVGVDVPHLEIALQPLGNPTTVRVSFSAEYDNVVPLRRRKMELVLDVKIRRLVGDDYYFDVVEHLEC